MTKKHKKKLQKNDMNENKRKNLTIFFKIGDIYLPILEGKNPDSGSLIHLYFSCCDKMTLVHSVLFKFNMNISRIVGIFRDLENYPQNWTSNLEIAIDGGNKIGCDPVLQPR